MDTFTEIKQKHIERNLRESSVDMIKLQIKCDKMKLKILKHQTPEAISEKVLQFIDSIKKTYNNLDLKILISIECYILTRLYDTITPIFYEAFKEEDDLIFKKCISLQNVQFIHELRGIQLPASIVELANLDAHKTVHEKVACITACYDCIFAELKHAMIELIAENGEETTPNRVNIPIVNNSDVVRLLVEVILRAKCMHLYSNLCFVQFFGDLHLTNDKCKHALLCFNEAIEAVTHTEEEFVKTHRRTHSEMDLKQYNAIMQRLDKCTISNHYERCFLTRVTKQISKSHDVINKEFGE